MSWAGPRRGGGEPSEPWTGAEQRFAKFLENIYNPTQLLDSTVYFTLKNMHSARKPKALFSLSLHALT